MKVIVFGATGTVGRLAVEELLKAGHSVTAFARAPQKLGISHPNLHLAAGDALNLDQTRAAIAGHAAENHGSCGDRLYEDLGQEIVPSDSSSTPLAISK